MFFSRDKKPEPVKPLTPAYTTPGVQAGVAAFIRRVADVIAGFVKADAFKEAPKLELFTEVDKSYFREQVAAAMEDLKLEGGAARSARATLEAMTTMLVSFEVSRDSKPEGTSDLSDGVEARVAAFVVSWGAIQRGEREFVADSKEAPLQLLTEADVTHFVKAMEDEAARIETEIHNVRHRRNAEIAQKDALIAAINRQIEAAQAKVADQAAEIDRRAQARVDLLETVRRIDPAMDASKIMRDADIRREVVRRKYGDVAVEGKSEAYIDERFESLAACANVDPFARVVADGIISNTQDSGRAAADRAYADYVSSLTDAHRTKH